MADEFEWRTDVDSGWEPREPAPVQAGGRRSQRRVLLIGIIGACLLLAAGVGVYRILSGRVEEATGTAESGLLLAHELLISGALHRDHDRVMSVVAERPASWHDLMADLMARQLFLGRRPLGLEVVRASAYRPLRDDDIRLAPELDAAEIVDRRPYFTANRGVTETVELEHVFFYERVGDQWQLSPPADERAFWGNWITDERDNVTVTYPERDEAVAIKLSGYLDSWLPALCAADGLACPDDFHLVLKLERDPTSLGRLAEGVYAIRASSAATGDRLVLPAPSLVGSPVNEAGYEALQRGYAGWIGASIVAGYGELPERLDEILAQFELRPPPAPVEPLPGPAMASFPAGSAPPNQDVLLLCSDESRDRLLRFDVSSGSWREEASGALWGRQGSLSSGRPSAPRSFISRLPDYRGIILHTFSGEGVQTIWRTYLYRDGSIRALTEERQVHYYLPPRLQPAGQPPDDLLVYFVPAAGEGEGFSALLVRVGECISSPCQTTALPGMPIWSPDGRRTVLITPESDGAERLYLGDRYGEIVAEVGIGQSPVWLDEHHFVYVARVQADPQERPGRWFGDEVLLVSVEQELPLEGELFFDAEMVRQAIPASVRPEKLALWTVQEAMPDSGLWYVSAMGDRGGERTDYVLLYDPLATETRLALPMEQYELVEPPMVNGSGQQAVIIGLHRDGSQVSIELIDAREGEIRRLAPQIPQDWSADGQWLIQNDQGILTLTSTAGDAQWPIQHELTDCYWAVWTEQQEKQTSR